MREPWVESAWTIPRERFCETVKHPLLLGRMEVVRPANPRISQRLLRLDLDLATTGVGFAAGAAGRVAATGDPSAPADARMGSDKGWHAVAVKKVKDTFPDAITVGRTAKNDVVIPDVMVSKLHAFIRNTEDSFELSDAGSRNGTYLDGVRLVAGVSGTPIPDGARLRFGRVEYRFLGPAAFWDAVQELLR